MNWKSNINAVAQHCHYPPPQECGVEQFSILIVCAEATHSSLRTLFLNLLHCLVMPEASEILVLLDDNMQHLENDVKYGHRILSWHTDDTHKVSVINESFPTRLGSRAVFMVDGNLPFSPIMNRRGLKFGFEVWKRHADSIVATHSWLLSKNESSRVDVDNNQPSTIVPLCKDEEFVANNDLPSATWQLPSLTGMWVHSEFLCALKYVAPPCKSDPLETKMKLIAWLLQVTKRPLHLYPPRLPFDKNSVIQDGPGLEEMNVKLLARLMHDNYGGMPRATTTAPVEWCVDDANGKPRPCSNARLLYDACR